MAKADVTATITQERSQFRRLILANPNHFGTRPGLALSAPKQLSDTTVYEELTCVGLQPELDQLEATVRLKLGAGYSGPLCSGGSTEYVRFYLSGDDGATWSDLGMESFTVYDTAGPRPLDYAVNRTVPVPHRLCLFANQPLVRAILSWEDPPDPDTPGFTPVWGNVADVRVQPRSSTIFFAPALFAELNVKLPEKFKLLLDPDEPVAVKAAQPLTLDELATTYAETEVEPHRFLFPYVQSLLTTKLPNGPLASASAALPSATIKNLGFELGPILEKLFVTDGNTDYEELDCIGYDPVDDALVGILTVKRPSGYSGGPCSGGSTEYVAFWVDWGEGAGFQYVGTAATQVHDRDVPDDGLRYAVYQPIPTATRRRNCGAGPVQPRVRAILSWATAPPPGNPSWVPTWGNREQTTIQLQPGAIVNLRPVVDTVGGVAVCAIDQTDGRTYDPADQPFGAAIGVTGFIPGAPDRSAAPLRYRIRVRPVQFPEANWQTLMNDVGVWITEQIGAALPVQYPTTLEADADGFYPYLEDPNPAGSGWRRIAGNVLGVWGTAAPMTGLWEIEVTMKDPGGGNPIPAQTIVCTDGTTRNIVRVRLDEVAPTTTFAITEFVRNGTTHPAEPCMKFKVGDLLRGTYSVSDEHFRHFSLTVEPPEPANGVTPVPSAGSFPLVATSGTSGIWELDTAPPNALPMDPCGYVLRFRAWDRTIVSGNGIGWEATVKTIGFSLET